MGRKMTITEGLAELKLLGSRIDKATVATTWCVAEANVKATKEYKEQIKKDLDAKWESLMALISERNKIKAAIVKSNADTIVKVGGREMTVAEAIDYKAAIVYEKALCSRLEYNFSDAKGIVEAFNARVQSRIDSTMQNLASSGTANIADAQKAIFDNYMEKNGYQLIDPLDVNARAKGLKEMIDEFEKNVDVALSVSNATTVIEI